MRTPWTVASTHRSPSPTRARHSSSSPRCTRRHAAKAMSHCPSHPTTRSTTVGCPMSDLWTYNADHRKRPNVHPLRTPSGRVLTRDAPEDHPWHHGLWFTIKLVNDENFWEEYDAYGVLRHVSPTTVHWIRPDRETVVIVDERTIEHVELDDDAYAIDWTVTLTPNVDVVLDRTEFTTWGGYGGLAFRGRGGRAHNGPLLGGGPKHERGPRGPAGRGDPRGGGGRAPAGGGEIPPP